MKPPPPAFCRIIGKFPLADIIIQRSPSPEIGPDSSKPIGAVRIGADGKRHGPRQVQATPLDWPCPDYASAREPYRRRFEYTPPLPWVASVLRHLMGTPRPLPVIKRPHCSWLGSRVVSGMPRGSVINSRITVGRVSRPRPRAHRRVTRSPRSCRRPYCRGPIATGTSNQPRAPLALARLNQALSCHERNHEADRPSTWRDPTA